MMDLDSLQGDLESAESFLPDIKAQRASSPFGNDVFEALSYWVDLGKRAFAEDARVDYRERAREELALLAKLSAMPHDLSLEARTKYVDTFAASRRLLARLEAIEPDENGYLGTLSALKDEFGFLERDYGFRPAKTQPTGIRYSSGDVYIELEYSINPSLSCSFGPDSEDETSFWIEDMLFLAGEKGDGSSFYEQKRLETKEEVHKWFAYLARVWKQYGQGVLTNQPGIFDRLAQAQAMRDAEHAAVSGQSELTK